MSKECDKHPDNFDGYSPKKFVEKFVKTNYFFQKEVFKLMPPEYLKEAKGDRKRRKNQLASGLEALAKAFENHVLPSIGIVCKACKKYLRDPYEKKI